MQISDKLLNSPRRISLNYLRWAHTHNFQVITENTGNLYLNLQFLKIFWDQPGVWRSFCRLLPGLLCPGIWWTSPSNQLYISTALWCSPSTCCSSPWWSWIHLSTKQTLRRSKSQLHAWRICLEPFSNNGTCNLAEQKNRCSFPVSSEPRTSHPCCVYERRQRPSCFEVACLSASRRVNSKWGHTFGQQNLPQFCPSCLSE